MKFIPSLSFFLGGFLFYVILVANLLFFFSFSFLFSFFFPETLFWIIISNCCNQSSFKLTNYNYLFESFYIKG